MHVYQSFSSAEDILMRITERGQVTIPKALRERYGITPAVELELLEKVEGILIVKKAEVSPLRRFVGKASAKGLPRTTDEFIRRVRGGE